MVPAQRARLPDGRMHLQHGPIDLVIAISAAPEETARAEEQAWARFESVLGELVAELPILRSPLAAGRPSLNGAVARRMLDAVWPHRKAFVTPMAAVAGAVADEILAALLHGRTIRKASVNNGGDVAFHLAEGESLATGIVASSDNPAIDAFARIDHEHCARGLATSGWRGRSQSLGIADAVTVFACNAAAADAAATLIANAVNAEHPVIERRPARDLKEDSDLGDRPVTVAVGTLPRAVRDAAIENGMRCAQRMHHEERIESALILLQGAAHAVAQSNYPTRRCKIATA